MTLIPEELTDLMQRAEAGDADSQNELAARLATGDGVEKSLELAVAWYKKAVEQDSAEAKYNLALMYLFGEGIDKNLDESKVLLNEAARDGSSDACLVLGEALETGNLNFDTDYLKAARYYLEAARLGSVKGIRCLGDLLEKNTITQKQLGAMMREYELDGFSQ